MLARCPHCREVFDAPAPGQQGCPKCGGALYVPPPVDALAAPAPGTPPGSAPPQPLEETPPPLEATPRGPLFAAFVETLKQVLTEPARFFDRLPAKGSTAAPLGFAVACLWAGSFVGAILERAMANAADYAALLDKAREQLGDNASFGSIRPWLEYLQPGPWSSVLLRSLFLTPIGAVVGVYITAGLNHLFLMLPGKAPRGFDATFRATAYACAPALLLAVPEVGGLVALVWAIVLMTMGLARVHKVPSAASFGAVIAPYIVLCCCGCGALALGAGAVMKFFGGSH